jgi:hypothetical protein
MSVVCGGLVDDGEDRGLLAEAAAGRVNVWLQPGAAFAKTSPDATHKKLIEGMQTWMRTCGLKFAIASSPGKARIDIYFKPKTHPDLSHSSGGNVLGRAWSSGKIVINQDRVISDSAKWRVLVHEMWHVLIRMDHTDDPESLNHPSLSGKWFVPIDSKRAVSRFGVAEKPWHPVPRVEAGVKVRGLIEELGQAKRELAETYAFWEAQKEQRKRIQEAGDWRPNHPHQAAILRTVDRMIAGHKEVHRIQRELSGASKVWHDRNRKWNEVRGVVDL